MIHPREEDVDVVLRDGSTLRVRPVTAGDGDGLRRFLEGLSPELRAFRFFTAVRDVSWAVRRALDVDCRDRHGIVALRGEDVVAHGLYALVRPGLAEMAMAVADAFQGRGLGTILLEHLAAHAARQGITEFTADVMSSNVRMLEVLRESGFPVESRASAGVVTVALPTSLTPEAVERFGRRARHAAVAAMRRFFRPRSIAVVGASPKRGTIGGELFHNLLASGFPGPVYAVSPHPVVQSVPAYQDVGGIPGPVDLAVIAVPAEDVAGVARACAARGVGALIVISAGFAEVGGAGVARQAELLEICRSAGMRLIGPNCMGVLSTAPSCPLNATFAPHPPPPGRVGVMSQSGALGLAVIEHARRTGLGISQFASVGDKADVSGNDLLEYWEEDGGTDVIVLYLESFGNARRFSRIARRVARRTPILAVKSGRSNAGARAAASHTGAAVAASDATVDALFRQSGVIRAATLSGLFDVAALLAGQPAPAGRRVGIVTNAGGLGILCADACASVELDVPPLAAATREAIAARLPATASTANPVDMIAGATSEQYEHAVATLGASGEVDAIIVIFIPPLAADAAAVTAAMGRAAAALEGRLPVLAVLGGGEGVPAPEGLPVFGFPEEAARALGRVAGWVDWRDRPPEEPWRVPGARPDRATAVVAGALGRGDGWLRPEEVGRVLDCYGIAQAPTRVAPSVRRAEIAAAELGGRVALKAMGEGIVHKSELGAVALGLHGARQVGSAARRMRDRLAGAGQRVEGFVVQRMIEEGVELLVGVTSDEVMGPIVACGAGGPATELLRDVQVALPPLSWGDGDRMLRRLHVYPLLRGYRGGPGVDLDAVREILLRVGALAEDVPEVAELDLNPVLATPSGAFVADARIRVAARGPAPPDDARPRR